MFPISDSIKVKKLPVLTIALVVVTTFVFLAQITSSNPDGFILKHALIPAFVNFNFFATLTPFITAIFLHGGFLHIISNMWFLWVFGIHAEDKLGFWLFFLLYFLSGIVGNLVQYTLLPSSNIPILGASGSIAGVLGTYYILFPNAKIKTLVPIFFLPLIIKINASLMLGYWFLLHVFSGVLSLSFSSKMGGVAFFAHVGGFATGILFATFFKTLKTLKKKHPAKPTISHILLKQSLKPR